METRIAVCLLTLLLGSPALGAGLPLLERAVLRAPDVMPDARLGFGVTLARDVSIALVGAANANCADGPACGAVYAYAGEGGSWGNGGKLTASDAARGDNFGWAIALSADGATALVGAPNRKCAAGVSCGAVYVFTRAGGVWSQAAELTTADAAEEDSFGYSVALSADGTTAILGAPFADCAAGAFCGAVYVFTGGGASWTQKVRLEPLDLLTGDNFGTAVALSADGTTALLGKPGDTCGSGFGCGAAYVFTGSGADWTLVKKIAAGDPQDHSNFGWSVALSEDGAYALVGRPYFDCAVGRNCGTAHVFTRATSWSEVARLAATAEADFAAFGFSAAVTDTGTALLGAPGATCGLNSVCGGAYLFSNTAGVWSQSEELSASATGSDLGIAVALANDANTALLGASSDPCPPPVIGRACGAVHVFAPLALIAVPALGWVGMAVLAVLLAIAGAVLLRRRAVLRGF